MSDVLERVHYDSAEDRVYIERVQDVEPIIKQVKREKEALLASGKKREGLGYKAGTIPGVVIEQYMKKVGCSYREFLIDDTHIKRIMNDPDYAQFRVWEGKI